MESIYPDAGLAPLNLAMVAGDQTWRLFTNNVTPTRATILGDLVEAAWGGYAPVTVTLAEWLDQGVAGHVAILLHPPITFLNSSGSAKSAYGYFCLDVDGNLVQVTRFDSAPQTKPDGDSFIVLPTWGDFSEAL